MDRQMEFIMISRLDTYKMKIYDIVYISTRNDVIFLFDGVCGPRTGQERNIKSGDSAVRSERKHIEI